MFRNTFLENIGPVLAILCSICCFYLILAQVLT